MHRVFVNADVYLRGIQIRWFFVFHLEYQNLLAYHLGGHFRKDMV
jgi:hypothetical protein